MGAETKKTIKAETETTAIMLQSLKKRNRGQERTSTSKKNV